MTTRKLATFLLIAAFALLGVVLLSSCQIPNTWQRAGQQEEVR